MFLAAYILFGSISRNFVEIFMRRTRNYKENVETVESFKEIGKLLT